MVRIPSSTFLMGNARGDGYPADGEEPVHEVTLSAYEMGATTVTNAQFAAFIEGTGYVTEAEQFGWSFVFAGFLPAGFPPTQAVAGSPWWRQVFGATWRSPEGPHSTIDGRGEHPVVHVSWNDAQAYCRWTGTRLPTEAEWECAARGGRQQERFPWGDELEPGGMYRMNVWQGTFPTADTGADGFRGTAPAKSFRPNRFGLYNATGNVWEWCQDWFDPAAYSAEAAVNPSGPAEGGARVMRGGSYLCHASYCNRYRVDARSSNTPDSSTGNIGFRVARDV
jgi:formylglycine-generating enzyme required for sulfatase activity